MSTNNSSESLRDLNETKVITNSIDNIKTNENDVKKSTSDISLNKTTSINNKKTTVISSTIPNKGRPRTTSLSNQNKSKVKVVSTSNTEKINATNPSKIIPSLTKTASATTKSTVNSSLSTKPKSTLTSNSTNSSTVSLKPNITTNVKSRSPITQKSKSSTNIKPKVSSPLKSKSSSTLKPKVTSTSTTVKPKISSATSTIKPKVSSGLNSVKPKVSSSLSSVKPKVSSGLNSVKPKVSSSLNSVKPKVSTSLNSVKPKVSTSLNSVKPKVSTSLNSVKPKVSSSLNTVKPKVSTSLNSVKPKVSSSLNSVKPKVSSSLNTVKPKVSSTHSIVKSSINSTTTSTTTNKIKSTPNSDISKKTRSTSTVNTLSKTKSTTGSSISTITKPKTSVRTSKVTNSRLNSTTNSRLKPSTASTSTIKTSTSSTLKKPSTTIRPRSSLSTVSASSNASKIKTSPTFTSRLTTSPTPYSSQNSFCSTSTTSTTHVRRKKPSPYANVKAKVNSLPSKSLSKNSSVSSNITVKPKNSTSLTAKKSSTLVKKTVTTPLKSNTDTTVKKENQEQPCLIVTSASIKKDEKEKEKLVENITKLEEDKNQTISENVTSLSKVLQDISTTDGIKLSNITPIESPLSSSPVVPTKDALKHDNTSLPPSPPGISKLNALNTDIIKTATINNEILNEYIKNIKYDPANVEHIDPNTLAFGDDEEEEEKQVPSSFIADTKHCDNISVTTDDFLDCESSFSDTKSSLISENSPEMKNNKLFKANSMSNLSTISSLSSITHKSSNNSFTSNMSIHALKSIFDNAVATQPSRSSPIPQTTHKIKKLNPQTLQLFEKPSSINDLDKNYTTPKSYTPKSTSIGLSKASSTPSSPSLRQNPHMKSVKARVDSNFNKPSTTKSTSVGLSKVSSTPSSPSLRQTPLMKAVKARVDSNLNKSSVTKSTTSIGLSKTSSSSPVTSPSLRQSPLMKAVKARVDSNFNSVCRSPPTTSVSSLNKVSLSSTRSKTPTIHNTLTKKSASTSSVNSVANRPLSRTSTDSTVTRNKTPTLSSSLPKSTSSTKSTVNRNKTPTLSSSLPKSTSSTKSTVTRNKTPTLSSSLSKTPASTGSLDKLYVTRTGTPTLSNNLSSPQITSATPTPPSPQISSKPVQLLTTIPRRNTRVTSLQPEAKNNMASSSETPMSETEDELEPMNESELMPPVNNEKDEKDEIGVSDIYEGDNDEEEEFHDSNDGTFLTENALIAEPETINNRKEEAIPSYTVKKHTLDQSQICEITEDSFILNQYVEDNNYYQTKHSNHEELIGDLIHADLIIDQIKQEAKRKAEEFKLNYEKEKKELENQKLEEKEGSIDNEQYDDVETETLNDDDGMSLGSISVKKLLKKNISSIIKPKNFTNLIKKRSSTELNESFESSNSLSDNNSEISAISEKRDSKGSTSYVLSMFMQSLNGANNLIKKKKNGDSTEDMKITISGPYQNNEMKPYDTVSLDSNLLGPNKTVVVPLNTTIEIPKRVSSAVPYSDDDSLSSSVASNSFKMNKTSINYPLKLDASSTIQSTPLKLLNKSIEKNKHISADSAIYLNDSITYENIKEIVNEEWTNTLNKQKFGVSEIKEESESEIETENGSSTSINSLKSIQNNEILRHLSISHESIITVQSEVNEEISEAQAVLQKQLKKINNIIYEITTTERTYVNELGKLLEIYYYPMEQNQVLNNNEMNILYSNIVDIYQFHSEIFYPKLDLVQKEHEKNIKLISEMDAFKSSSSFKLINETISIEAFFKIVSWPFQFLYKPYYINFKKASDFVTILNSNQKHKYNSNNVLVQAEEFGFSTNCPIFERENKKKLKKLRAYLKSSTERMDHKQVDILGYLILPIQRLPRYLLLLEGLAKSTKLLEEAVAKLVPKGFVLERLDEDIKKKEEEEAKKEDNDISLKDESKREEEKEEKEDTSKVDSEKKEKEVKLEETSNDNNKKEEEKAEDKTEEKKSEISNPTIDENTNDTNEEGKNENVNSETENTDEKENTSPVTNSSKNIDKLKDTLNKSSNEIRNNIESRKANDRTERNKKAPINVKSMIAQIEGNNNSKIPARSGVRNNIKYGTKINKNGFENSIRNNNKNIHSGIPAKVNNNNKNKSNSSTSLSSKDINDSKIVKPSVNTNTNNATKDIDNKHTTTEIENQEIKDNNISSENQTKNSTIDIKEENKEEENKEEEKEKEEIKIEEIKEEEEKEEIKVEEIKEEEEKEEIKIEEITESNDDDKNNDDTGSKKEIEKKEINNENNENEKLIMNSSILNENNNADSNYSFNKIYTIAMAAEDIKNIIELCNKAISS